jgi:hypothetical protein
MTTDNLSTYLERALADIDRRNAEKTGWDRTVEYLGNAWLNLRCRFYDEPRILRRARERMIERGINPKTAQPYQPSSYQ